ncbi:hypothetical protein L202_03075 [Cryptococcus amylolentus CBS 6039]|uniref:NAD(P)-binding protein n=1 Tax=Cryptococcus amylolentus CBS 6039 TaxID=1295533 RepID=A0A1E3HX97_9TREE|nr:hypothetical protein L202_03075 [Cryptococcus amylolentus CBS 6039]ODN80963.1 hypothetical protein L202_03075 [Cryptococcus amylolentus CBS 6039]
MCSSFTSNSARMTFPGWIVALVVPPLLLLRSRPLPSRETVIPPNQERVLLLGASSGVGKDLALAYARKGAKLFLVARREDALQSVKEECLSVGGEGVEVLVFAGDVTNAEDLVAARDMLVKAWQGVDTVHILAGLPSTSQLLELGGVSLDRSTPENSPPSGAALAYSSSEGPSLDGLKAIEHEAKAVSHVNYLGTVLSLSCFLPVLASSSKSPVLHHLSSVAATVPAPHRVIYAATKAAALQAVESARVECEGCGVRFFSLCPGTIDNDFRLKTVDSQTGGRDETKLAIKHSWEKLLLSPKTVTDTILYHLSLSPAPQPLIPYPPFNFFRALDQPPKHLVHLPLTYRFAMFVRDTPLGWGYIEPAARRKYGLVGRA